jgi:hypothetical protein
MKSLKSIAQQKSFELNKLEVIARDTKDLMPFKAGGTLLYSSDDSQVIINNYYAKHRM